MRRSLFLATLAVLAACDGDNQDKKDLGTGDTADPPPSFTFKTAVRAKSYQATLPPEVVTAHQVSGTLFAGMGMVVADEKVGDRMTTDAGEDPQPVRFTGADPASPIIGGGALDCWTREQFPMFSFPLDYTSCEDYGVSGGVFIEDHPSGPLLFNFLNWRVQNRTLGGTVALDTRGAFPDAYFWQLYNTDPDNPGLPTQELVPLGVQLAAGDGRTSNPLLVKGGARLDRLNQRFAMWGTVETGPADARITVVHGGAEPTDVVADDPPDDAIKLPLNWLSCRCPLSGVSTYDMPLDFTQVVLDIDDLEDEPDDVDDPEITIPVGYRLEGRGLLHYSGCGEYEVEYQTADASVPLTVEALTAVLSFQCATKAIDDEPRCNALLAAADRLETLSVTIGQNEVTRTALDAVLADFDVGFCNVE